MYFDILLGFQRQSVPEIKSQIISNSNIIRPQPIEWASDSDSESEYTHLIPCDHHR